MLVVWGKFTFGTRFQNINKNIPKGMLHIFMETSKVRLPVAVQDNL